MAFTQFTYDMDIIAKLSDSPNVDDGLTADQLKAKFDEAGKAVKDYINNVLLPEALEKPRFTGLVKSNGRGFVQAEAGVDYSAPLTAGTDYQTPLEAGTDYQTPLTAEQTRKIFVSTADPTAADGADGDLWVKLRS